MIPSINFWPHTHTHVQHKPQPAQVCGLLSHPRTSVCTCLRVEPTHTLMVLGWMYSTAESFFSMYKARSQMPAAHRPAVVVYTIKTILGYIVSSRPAWAI